jgi:hypothetical protein
MSTCRGREFLQAALIAFLSAGCADTPVIGSDRSALVDLGTVGIVSLSSVPEIEIRELPPRGAADGAVTGVAQGAVGGALFCSLYMPLFPMIPPCIAVMSAAGLGTGMSAAREPDTVDAAHLNFQRLESMADWQCALRQRVIALAETRHGLRLADLGELPAPKSQITGEPALHSIIAPARQDNRPDPASIEYLRYTGLPVDTVLEIGPLKISTWASGADKYGIRLTARTRLVRAVDGAVLAEDEHHSLSPSLSLADWAADEGIALARDMVNRGLDHISADIASQHFPEQALY